MATKAPAKSKALAVTGKASSNIVSIKDALARELASLAGKTAPPGGDMIRMKGKEFILPDGTKTPGPLDLVIVDFVSSNKFYEGAYDPNNITPPACFAIGDSPTTLVPSVNSPLKQSDSCATCPMNQFGSSGKGKACSNARLLAVLPPDADADTPIWLLSVSPTALKGFDGYVNSVARQFQLPPVGVITSVGLNPNEAYPQLTFSDPQPNTQVAEHFARKEEARTRLMTEPDVSAFEVPQPKAKGKTVARR
jgi:hypothetical protein